MNRIIPLRARNTWFAPLLLSAVLAFGGPAAGSAHATNTHTNDIPPRFQWEANYGYCGEVAMISAGLYYGQYASQYDVRAIASRNIDQTREDSQLLLSANDLHAAARMRLKAVAWKEADEPDARDFLTWVKKNVLAGHPVIIGIYYNFKTFENNAGPLAGDEDYDHIVPVTGISSRHSLEQPVTYYGDDVLTLSDNGFWAPDGPPVYFMNYGFDAMQASREEANSDAHSDYSLAGAGRHFGVAITGIVDKDGQTLPVRLTTDVNHETPEMKQGQKDRPAASPVNLTVRVSGLKPGTKYRLYRYDSFEKVPESGFNAKAANAKRSWTIQVASGSTYSLQERIQSDEVAVYRAVPVTAP